MFRKLRRTIFILLPIIPTLLFLLTIIIKIWDGSIVWSRRTIISPGSPFYDFDDEQLTSSVVKSTTTSTTTISSTKVSLDNDNSIPNVTFVGSGFIYYQTIRECQCSRRVMYPPPHQVILIKLNSSCSDEGTHYQFNQNVISTSMFFKPTKPGKLKEKIHTISNYQPGLLHNLARMRQHFPGYSLRIYTNISLQANSSWCPILCGNEDLFWCDIRNTPSHGNLANMNFRTWRFLALGDPTVKMFLSRDLDSLLNYREGAVVQDWLENVGNKAFHLMRDRKKWHNMSILAGLWGAQNGRLLENNEGVNLREEVIKLSKRNKTGYWVDRNVIEQLIFRDRARDVVAYDSYQCNQWAKHTDVRPFPVQRRGHPAWDFVGTIVDFKNMNADAENKSTKGKRGPSCPVECRPDYGKDWLYC